MTDTALRTREARARRAAERQGLRLQKSRRRDPRAWDYGGYQLIDPYANTLVFGSAAGHGFGASLEQIERWLDGDR